MLGLGAQRMWQRDLRYPGRPAKKQQGMTMTHLGNIRESDIQTAVSMAEGICRI